MLMRSNFSIFQIYDVLYCNVKVNKGYQKKFIFLFLILSFELGRDGKKEYGSESFDQFTE